MSKEMKRLDLTQPVSIWRSQDLLRGKPVNSITMILRTVGCKWNSCIMCGYASEGAPATAENLISQFEKGMHRSSPEVQIVKIYTSGSFLDPKELPEKARDEILRRLEEKGVKKLVIESRPEYITSERVDKCLSYTETEFAIGLETSNDLIRQHVIRKGFSFQDFVNASQIIHERGGSVKAYLLLKPPLLSEAEALKDAIGSARAAQSYADILSLNLCNVQRGTYVEHLWERNEYRPPWLWSALEVLKNVDGPILCDPVGAGTKRGPHNCGECDSAVAKAIRDHALVQDTKAFDGLGCKCIKAWRSLMELEDKAFGTTLA